METLGIPACNEATDVHVHLATEEAEEAGGEYLARAKKLFKDGVHAPAACGRLQPFCCQTSASRPA